MCIVFKNGDVKIYGPDEYTDYRYFKEVFVVLKRNQWIGIYSMDEIRSIEVEPGI